MIRCSKLKSLAYLNMGGMLFADEEANRWLTVDRGLSTLFEYTGNGRFEDSWDCSADGLVITIAPGYGIASGAIGITVEDEEITVTDDTTTYIYAEFSGDEHLNVGEGTPEYNPTNISITSGASFPDYCAKIATVVAASGVATITMEDPVTFLSDMYDAGKAIIDAHKHDGVIASKIDLTSHVTGLLSGEHIGAVDASLLTGEVTVAGLGVMSHRGLWYFPLEVTKHFGTTSDYYTYYIQADWLVGVAPGVYRNSVLVDSSEYSYNQTDHSITFAEKQNIGAEIEIAVDFTTYTADIDVDTREDVTLFVYKNRKRVTNYVATQGTDTVTVVFDTALTSSDEIMVCALGYFIIDVGNNSHDDIDDAVSKLDSFGCLAESEVIQSLLLQRAIADDHISLTSFNGVKIFTFGVDDYDEELSTIDPPNVEEKYVEIDGGDINDLYFDFDDGEFYRTKNDDGLKLDYAGGAVNLVIDKSGSMLRTDPTNVRIAAAKALVDLFMLEVPGTIFNVILFNDTITRITSAWTSDKDTVYAAIDQAASAERDTDIYGAVVTASDNFSEVPSEYAKITVLLTDGMQTAESLHTVAEGVANHKTASGVYPTPIYSVALGQGTDTSTLLTYSRETGGVLYYCAAAEDMTELGAYILYGDDDTPSFMFNAGHWVYDLDFEDTRMVTFVNSAVYTPSGTTVKIGYQTSDDGVSWGAETILSGSEINVLSRYFRFTVYLYGYRGSSPVVSSFGVSYVEPVEEELWMLPDTTDVPLFECLFSPVISPDPSGTRVRVGVWSGGEFTWENCSEVIVVEGLTPKSLWRGFVWDEHYEEYRFVVKFTNFTSEVMRVHDLGFMFNKKGVY